MDRLLPRHRGGKGDQVAKHKLKTHRGAAKRFRRTATGKIRRARAFKRHLLTGKPSKRMRQLGGTVIVDPSDVGRIRRMLPYLAKS